MIKSENDKAGLTPTTPVTSIAISPVKMSIGCKSLTNLRSEMIFLQGKPVFCIFLPSTPPYWQIITVTILIYNYVSRTFLSELLRYVSYGNDKTRERSKGGNMSHYNMVVSFIGFDWLILLCLAPLSAIFKL
jgi:hypothetical protein